MGSGTPASCKGRRGEGGDGVRHARVLKREDGKGCQIRRGTQAGLPRQDSPGGGMGAESEGAQAGLPAWVRGMAVAGNRYLFSEGGHVVVRDGGRRQGGGACSVGGSA